MARHSEGKRLIGTDPTKRHVYNYYGKLIGYRCRICALPKPSLVEDEVQCGGSPILTPEEARKAREASLPNYLMGLAWAIQKSKCGWELDPNAVIASRAAFLAPILRYGHTNYERLALKVIKDGQTIYKSCAVGDPRATTYGTCLFAAKLCTDGKLDPTNQAVMTGLVVIEEATESPKEYGYQHQTSQEVARRMIKAARSIGYYGGVSNLIPA